MKIPWPFRREPEMKVRSIDDLTLGQFRELQAKGVTWDGFTPRGAAYGIQLPAEAKVDYAKATENGMGSSVVTSALCWVMRTFPEAPVVVQRIKEERWETQSRHDLAELIRRPNPEYGGRVLWMSTILDFCFGEAFWLKVRDGTGKLVELWWAPRATITPKASERTGLLSHYEYKPGGNAPTNLSLTDVVHFRFGKDPANILRGFSPLAAVMREVYTDDQAATFTAAILRNLGIVGLIISPKGGAIPKDVADNLQKDIQSKFTGENRAKAMLFTHEVEAKLLQYNLQGFDVGPIRDIAEERVCAALAIPAAVIGFGTGLQQTKVGATMREMVKLAWQGGIEPNQAIMADELDRSLLPEFHKNDGLFRTHFDTSQVEALTESPKERTDRVATLLEKNIITFGQAQQELGYPVDAAIKDRYARELAAPKPAGNPAPDTDPAGDPAPQDTPPGDSDNG